MKQTLEEAAREYAENLNYSRESQIYLFEKSFIAGAKWREAQIPEHITIEQAYITGARDTKKRAVKELRIALEKWVHGNKADCVIEAFEELINK